MAEANRLEAGGRPDRVLFVDLCPGDGHGGFPAALKRVLRIALEDHRRWRQMTPRFQVVAVEPTRDRWRELCSRVEFFPVLKVWDLPVEEVLAKEAGGGNTAVLTFAGDVEASPLSLATLRRALTGPARELVAVCRPGSPDDPGARLWRLRDLQNASDSETSLERFARAALESGGRHAFLEEIATHGGEPSGGLLHVAFRYGSLGEFKLATSEARRAAAGAGDDLRPGDGPAPAELADQLAQRFGRQEVAWTRKEISPHECVGESSSLGLSSSLRQARHLAAELLLSNTDDYSLSPLAPELPFMDLEWDAFERFCCDLAHSLPEVQRAYRHGVQGDAQDGIDISATLSDGQLWVFQCKREQRFGPAKLQDAIAGASLMADRYVLLLASRATKKVRSEATRYPKWDLWDADDLSRQVRLLPAKSARVLVETYFGAEWRRRFPGIAGPTQFVEAADFFAPLLTPVSPCLDRSGAKGRPRRPRVILPLARFQDRGGPRAGRDRQDETPACVYRNCAGHGRGATTLVPDARHAVDR